MTDIHIITSAKGGVGKTMCSLACLWAYRQRQRHILALDVNVHNPDFAKLVSMGTQPRSASGDFVQRWEPFPWLTVERLGKPYRLPYGAKEIWQFVQDSCQRNPQTPCVIVDTGLHPLNLLRTEGDEQDIIEGFLSLQEDRNSQIRVYLWFVWTIATVLDSNPAFGLGDTLQDFDDLLRDWNELWNEGSARNGELLENIHVVNPYSLYRPIDFVDLLEGFVGINRKIPINDLLRIKKDLAPIPVKLGFSEFGEYIRKVAVFIDLPQNRFRPMYIAFKQGVDIGGDVVSGRPCNVFPITHHFETASDFPLYLLQHLPRNENDLIYGYEEFGEAIDQYLKSYC